MKPSLIATLLISTLILLQPACRPAPQPLASILANGEWIDLTHAFTAKTVYWPTDVTGGFRLDTQFHGHTPGGYFYAANAFCAPEHGGTHLDAPIHFAEGRHDAAEIPLNRLMGPAVVIDISDSANANADYQIKVSDVEAWEAWQGPLPQGCILLFRTGWNSRYPDAARYLGTAEKGPDAVSKLHFPGIHPDLARWLVANRQVNAVGIDVASLDYGPSTDFLTHRILYEQNIPGFENLTGLDQLPPTGAYVWALPMKIEGGSGGPLRMIAWIPKKSG